MGSPWILVAEDDADDQELTVSAFLTADTHFRIQVANNGQEAPITLANIQ